MTERVVSFPRRMTPQEFEASVRDRAATGFDHMVFFTDHATERMTERGVTRTMVLRVLRRGSVDGPKLQWSEDHGSWSAPITGISAGVEVTVVCAIRRGDLIVRVVTTYGGAST